MADALAAHATMKSDLIIFSHLGMGDMFIINGLVRHKARSERRVWVMCKTRNAPTCRDMWGDIDNVGLIEVEEHTEADKLAGAAEKKGHEVLRLGLHHPSEPLDYSRWDHQIYEQAGLSPIERMSGWPCVANEERQIPIPPRPYIFVHDKDQMRIDERKLPRELQIKPHRTVSMLDWQNVIANASQIHCIDSSFACWIDCWQPNVPLFLHQYARQGSPPKWMAPWHIIS